MNKRLIALLTFGLGIAAFTIASAAVGSMYFSTARKSIRQVKLSDPANIKYQALGLVRKDVGQHLTAQDIVNLGVNGNGIDLMQFIDTSSLPKDLDYELKTTATSKAKEGIVTDLVFTAFKKDSSRTIADTFQIPEQIGYKQSARANNFNESEISLLIFKLSKSLKVTLNKEDETTRQIFGLASASDEESSTKTIDQVIAALEQKMVTASTEEAKSKILSEYLKFKFDNSLLSFKQKIIFGSGRKNAPLFKGSLANGDLQVSVTIEEYDEAKTAETKSVQYKSTDTQLYIPLLGYKAARFDNVVNSLTSKLDLLSLVQGSTERQIQEKQQQLIGEVFTIKANTKLNTITAEAASQNIKEYLTSLKPEFEKSLNIGKRYSITYKAIQNGYDNTAGTLKLLFTIAPTISTTSNPSLIDNQKGFDITVDIHGFKKVTAASPRPEGESSSESSRTNTNENGAGTGAGGGTGGSNGDAGAAGGAGTAGESNAAAGSAGSSGSSGGGAGTTTSGGGAAA